MPIERDPYSLAWLEARLASEFASVRRRAFELLEYVDCEQRAVWLKHASSDADMGVKATAAIVGAIISTQAEEVHFELRESDFASGAHDEDLEWEWEYRVRVCSGEDIGRGDVVVWTTVEDDAIARRLAVMKSGAEYDEGCRAVAFIISRRYVTRFTRSPKNHREAARWHEDGRPRYEGGQSTT